MRSITVHGVAGTHGSLEAMELQLTALPPRAELEAAWQDLQRRSPHTFFTSWQWIGAWLGALPPQVEPRLLVGRIGTRIALLAVLTTRLQIRHGFIVSRVATLHETGDKVLDDLTIEYNGWLADAAIRPEALGSLHTAVLQLCNADELRVSGWCDRSMTAPRAGNLLVSPRSYTRPVYAINLDKVRDAGTDYIQGLSSNRRSQLRRALKAYSALGEVAVHRATSAAEAMELFGVLVSLHQAHWQSRGQSGSFASEFALRFHRELVTAGVAQGTVALLDVRAGTRRIGVMYCFVDDGALLFYQSGLDYQLLEKESSPGFVAHHAVVQWALSQGFREYNFLAGEARYKRTLANEESSMQWTTYQRPLVRFRAEHKCIAAVRRLRSLLRRSKADPGASDPRQD